MGMLMMKERLSFYLQKNNTLFGDAILTVCYKATDEEIQKYSLTSENIVLFLKGSNVQELLDKKDINYYKEIPKLFGKDKVFLRIQCECLLGIYGDSHCDCEQQRLNSIKLISENCGVYVHLP